MFSLAVLILVDFTIQHTKIYLTESKLFSVSSKIKLKDGFYGSSERSRRNGFYLITS